MIKKEINNYNIDSTKLNPAKFKKDDDSNGHIDFIFSFSIIRGRNYNIKEISRQRLKIFAGRIVPTILTTTVAITGIVCLQLHILNKTTKSGNNKINYFKNCYMNLAVNTFIISNPSEKIRHKKKYDEDLGTLIKAIPLNWTV
jgi:hypothetical protein